MQQAAFHGLEIEIRRFGGARAVRVVHPERQEIDSHRHEWPYLSLPALGGYRETSNDGHTHIAGPAAILHGRGAEHANVIGTCGLETVTVEFDPEWMACTAGVDFGRSHRWLGGRAALAARTLAASWYDPACDERALAFRTAAFLRHACASRTSHRPAWLGEVERSITSDRPPTTAQLATRMGMHPAWLARAYRDAVGEGVHDTLRRRRVERATTLLRRTDLPLAEVALDCGFCDQSHMNRAFSTLSRRTPLQVRHERQALPAIPPPS